MGLEESCICQPSPMVLGIDVPAVAFPVEEMQQAERAGSSTAPSAGSSPAPSELRALSPEGAAGELFMCAGAGCGCEQAGACFVRQPQSVAWLLKAQMVRQHRTSPGLDIIPSSAKVSSLPLTPSNLSVLP